MYSHAALFCINPTSGMRRKKSLAVFGKPENDASTASSTGLNCIVESKQEPRDVKKILKIERLTIMKPKVDWKRKFEWHLPELDMYCGCTNLRTGIYIRTGIGVLVKILYICSNGGMICYLFGIRGRVDEFFEVTETSAINDPDVDTSIKEISRMILLTYVLSWIVLKIMHILMGMLVLFAVLKKIPKLIKCYVYFSMPIWIVDILVSAIGFIFSSVIIKVLVMACLLTEGYNLLAINSEYKKQSGKSRLKSKDEEPEEVIPNEYICQVDRNITFHDQYTKHCNTCTCQITPLSCTTPSTSSTPSISTNLTIETDTEEKDLNFKEETVIYDQNQLGGSAVEEDDLEPKDLDSPVIYDANQLNVGSNHVVEDRIDFPLPSAVLSERSNTIVPFHTIS